MAEGINPLHMKALSAIQGLGQQGNPQQGGVNLNQMMQIRFVVECIYI